MERKDKSVKRLKRDKSEVLDILFQAFTKHQFYNIKHLEKITAQPTVRYNFFDLVIRFHFQILPQIMNFNRRTESIKCCNFNLGFIFLSKVLAKIPM